MLGSHALHQVLSRASTKEDLLMLGMMDEYKHSEHAASSPSGSSPESHNSDTSVEVGDGRLGGHRGHHMGHHASHGLGHGLGGLGGALAPFPTRPSPLQPVQHGAGPPPPPHPAAKELLLPLHQSLQSLPFMLPHPAFLQAHCPPFMFPPGVLPRAFNNNTTPFNNNNNNNNETLEYSKRFYLDSILHAPRPHYRGHGDHGDDGDVSDGAEEAKAPRRRPSSPPQPKIAQAAPVDDRPMDLSVRSGGSAASDRDADACSVGGGADDDVPRARRPSSDVGRLADDDRSVSGASEGGGREDEDEEVDVEVTRAPERTLRVIPLDLSART